ncbi:RyR domain-containing protein [Aliiroseovarius sp.]|uniref:RyR domain-containing protein n=1 Tax=Aliiroseovarius sp. TaxID=1872442 RepID=UPI00262BCBC9|nr:RyR domain-containing protein [Aliiroseovarius sp.]
MRRFPVWLWLILLFCFVSGMALFGLKGARSWTDFIGDREFVDDLYGVVQLFVVEGRVLEQLPGGPGSAHWALLSAAFLAPVVTIFAFLQLVWSDLADAASRFFHRRLVRGHTVVVGMGARGQALIRDSLAQGKRVVAIDRGETMARVFVPRPRRFFFVGGDAGAAEPLRQAGAARASEIIVFCGGDHENIAISRLISAQIGADVSATAKQPRIICHANASHFRDQVIEDQSLAVDPAPKIEFYSPEEAAARQFVLRFPPWRYAKWLGRHRPNIALFGEGPLAREIIHQIAIHAQTVDGPIPAISVICENAAWVAPIAERLASVCEIGHVPADFRGETAFADTLVAGAEPFSQYVVCMEDDWVAVDFVLRLREATRSRPGGCAPIFCSPQMMGWTWSETAGSARPYPSTLVTAFGVSPNVLGWHQVVAQQQDRMARINHQTYVAEASRSGSPDTMSKPAARPWADLGEQYRYSNRSFVDHISAKLDLIGCTLSENAAHAPAELSEDEFALMARAEHDRWVAERLVLGWQPDESRDDQRKLHPDLLPWQDLPEAVRAYDMALVRAIPALVESVGKRIARVTRLGVSGHRDTGISLKNRALVSKIDATLDEIRRTHPGHVFELVSPLAEGADRVVAQRSMSRLGARLIVPLPFALDIYRADFLPPANAAADPARRNSLKEFHELLNEAEQVFELPLLDPANQTETGRQRQFSALGAWLLQHCDHIVLVWDGAPAAGPGGTGDVAAWARRGSVPQEYRWAGTGAVRAQAHVLPFERNRTISQNTREAGRAT